MREVVSLQFGSLSNHVGAHFFNFENELCVRQQSISDEEGDHEGELNDTILLRSDKNRSARVVAVDRCGSATLDPSSDFSAELEQQNTQETWSGESTVIAQRNITSNPFLEALQRRRAGHLSAHDYHAQDFDLSGSIRRWSDYLEASIAPKSFVEVEGVHPITSFDVYSVGVAKMTPELKEDMFDRVRSLAEECDHIQGFQCLVDVDDAFGGVGSTMIEEVRDEFTKTSIMSLSLSSESPASTPFVDLNHCLAFSKLYDISSSLIPIQTSHWTNVYPFLDLPQFDLLFQPSQKYHTSAIIAAALQALSVSYKKKSNGVSISDLLRRVNPVDTFKLASLSVAFAELPSFIPSLTSRDPFVNLSFDPRARTGAGSGVKLGDLTVLSGSDLIHDARLNQSSVAALNEWLNQSQSTHVACSSSQSMFLPKTFPKLFENQTCEQATHPNEVSCLAQLWSGTSYRSLVREYRETATRTWLRRRHLQHLDEAGFELEEFETVKENLYCIESDYDSYTSSFSL